MNSAVELSGDDIADYDEDENMCGVNNADDADLEPEEMQKRVLEMEEELEQLTKLQKQVDSQISTASDKIDENSMCISISSVFRSANVNILFDRYVGQVDYEATPEELRAHFAPCGTINRITIMCDKITGQAKGCVTKTCSYNVELILFILPSFAYIEFTDKDAVDNAMKLDDSLLKGRQIKVRDHIFITQSMSFFLP